MWQRPPWQRSIENAWHRRSVLWLMGARRTGKTVLCQSLDDIEYLDCELPSVRRALADPEAFLASRDGRRIALDEVHRLDDPASLLKIAADHWPRTRIIATGSSTLGASARFRDTLAGRKHEIWLTPMTLADVAASGRNDPGRRLLHGGLPPFFLADTPDERDYQEWIEAYWAKDILELFRLERKRPFERLLELLLAQSGGMFEAAALAPRCDISRTSVTNYLAVLDATFVVHVVRPFASNPASEIVSAPRVYGFDTGFVASYRGWRELRPSDEELLFEHLVLNELHAQRQRRDVHYWRNKRGLEIDFVLPGTGDAPPTVIECKRNGDEFDPAAIAAFRASYPGKANYVVAMDVRRPYEHRYDDLTVRFLGLPDLIATMQPGPPRRSTGRRSRR